MLASFPGSSVLLVVAISPSNWYLVFSHLIPSAKEFDSNCTNSTSMVKRPSLAVSHWLISSGEGSFFKAHQDTPHSEDLFGSLVCLLPSTHEGGNLLLRHRDRKLTFDGQALLQGAPPASIAWVGFFGDVEHEVALVTSGHRITITFNLYFEPNFARPVPQATSHLFKSALKKLINDPLLSSVHPCLGFGLEYAYPFERAVQGRDFINLKGVDATLIQILNDLGADYRFYLLYKEDACPFRILSKNIIDGDYIDEGDESIFNRLVDESFIIWDSGFQHVQDPSASEDYHSDWWYGLMDRIDEYEKSIKSMDIEWVTEPNEEHLDRSVVVKYGNEASLTYVYHYLCVVARVIKPAPNEKHRQGGASSV